MSHAALTAAAFAVAISVVSGAETYRGIKVAPEHRCALHDRSDYRYSQSIKQRKKGLAEVIIGKQRNGPIGTVELTFTGSLTKLESHADSAPYTHTREHRQSE